MKEKQLRRLSKLELMELLLVQKEENERLAREVESLKRQLEDRHLRVEKAGSMAEAALLVNGVLEAAQKAAEQYLYNLKEKTGEGTEA